MKEKLLVLGTMVALCCSCAGSSVLLDTESELNGLNNEYELGTLEAGDNGLTYIIHSGFISGYQNRYGDNLKPPTNVYHRMTA